MLSPRRDVYITLLRPKAQAPLQKKGQEACKSQRLGRSNVKRCLLVGPQHHELLWIQLPAQNNIPNWNRKEFKASTLAEEGKSVFFMTWPLVG